MKKKFKLFIMTFLSLLFVLTVGAALNVQAIETNKIAFDEETKTLTVNGNLSEEEFESIKNYKTSAENVVLKDVEYENCSSMFEGFSVVKDIKVDGLKTNQVKRMFYNCTTLNNVDFKNTEMSNVTDMSYMFYNCLALTSSNLNDIDVSNVTNMQSVFMYCNSLEEAGIDAWDVSNVENMQWMFCRCSNIKNIPISKWNVSKVTNMFAMFELCQKLEEIDIEDWNVSKVITMQWMFNQCRKLKKISLKNWDVSNVRNMGIMFQMCDSLEELDIENWNVASLENIGSMFNGCNALKNTDLKASSVYRVQYKNKDNVIYKKGGFVKPDTVINEEAKDIEGYRLSDDKTKSLTVTKNIKENVITFNYDKAFKVVFKDSEGNVLKTQYVFEGDSVKAPEDMKKDSTAKYTYTFEGWDKNFDNVKQDIEVNPVYKAEINKYNYKVVYRCKDQVLETIEGISEYDSEVNVAAKEFEGYALKSGAEGKMIINENDNTLYFDYVKTYKVTFKDCEGNVIKEEVVEDGNNAIAPEAPVKEATDKYTYTFEGWDKSFEKVTSDIEVNPVFSEEVNKYKYTIVYRCNDEVLETVQGEADYGSVVKVETKEFKKYKFKSKTAEEIIISVDADNNIVYVDYKKGFLQEIIDMIKNFIKLCF